MSVEVLCQFHEEVWEISREGSRPYMLGTTCSRRLVPLGRRNATHELGSIKECVSIFHAVDCGVNAVVDD